jgi:hypothetical protein
VKPSDNVWLVYYPRQDLKHFRFSFRKKTGRFGKIHGAGTRAGFAFREDTILGIIRLAGHISVRRLDKGRRVTEGFGKNRP